MRSGADAGRAGEGKQRHSLKEEKMKKIILWVFLIFPLVGFSQNPTSTPSSTPAPTPQPQSQPSPSIPPPSAQTRQSIRGLSDSIEEKAFIEEQRIKTEKRELARKMIDELYRKPTKKELMAVSVDDSLRARFAELLKQDNTGIFKFLTESKCVENSNIISADEDCLKNKMPGAGASYSFRINSYRIPQLADLSYAQNTFVTVGNWVHGLLLDIGDVPLEKVDLQTEVVRSLVKFQPASNFETATAIDTNLIEGIRHEGKIYRRHAVSRENTTYLLRTIAYRGNNYKTAQGFVYNEFDYDKRKDLLIAFRLVQTDPDGSITIVWKQLAEKDSPKIVQRN